MRYDVIEFSASGVTLPRTALEAQGLHALRRGEPCPATIQVFGEVYGVVLRLAAQAPLHVEFAFVSLAPQARRALEHYAAQSHSAAAVRELPKPFALAFARLAGAIVPDGRRLVLSESAAVYAMTVEREARPLAHHAPPVSPAPPMPDPDVITLTGRELLAYATALLALLSLVLMWALG